MSICVLFVLLTACTYTKVDVTRYAFLIARSTSIVVCFPNTSRECERVFLIKDSRKFEFNDC